MVVARDKEKGKISNATHDIRTKTKSAGSLIAATPALISTKNAADCTEQRQQLVDISITTTDSSSITTTNSNGNIFNEAFLSGTRQLGSESFGSARRQYLLNERRRAPANIWKAHEKGISISPAASWRSLYMKQKCVQQFGKLASTKRVSNNFEQTFASLSSSHRAEEVVATNQILRRQFTNRAESTGSIVSLSHAKPVRSASDFSLKELLDGCDSLASQETSNHISPRSNSHLVESRGTKASSSNNRVLFKSSHSASFLADVSEESNSGSSCEDRKEGNARKSNKFESMPPSSPYKRLNSSMSSIPSLYLSKPVRSQSFQSNALFDDCDWVDTTGRETSIHSRDSSFEGVSSFSTANNRNISSPHVPISKPLLARLASENNYHGEGFEVSQDTPRSSLKQHPRQNIAINDDKIEEIFEMNVSRTKSAAPKIPRPVLFRETSSRRHSGQGIEVADWKIERPTLRKINDSSTYICDDSCDPNDGSICKDNDRFIRQSLSFDSTMQYTRVARIFKTRRGSYHRRSFSDSAVILANTQTDKNFVRSMQEDYNYHNPWLVLDVSKNNPVEGDSPLCILGTSGDDKDCHPHVLSPPLMESLQMCLPYGNRDDSLWLRYSLVRDGASIRTLLHRLRGSSSIFLAIETIEGDVFGSFTSSLWRVDEDNPKVCHYGSGESFLWKMNASRLTKTWSVIDQANIESDIATFPFTGFNQDVQLCGYDQIGIGGSSGLKTDSSVQQQSRVLRDGSVAEAYEFGFGIYLKDDLLQGTSYPCLTFNSPALTSTYEGNNGRFEVVNLEAWALTPCLTEVEAQRLASKHQFFVDNAQG